MNPAAATRRRFLERSLILAGGSAVTPRSLFAVERPAPSERVAIGVIGTGNQGISEMLGFLEDPRVQVVAVCDVNRRSNEYWAGKPGGRDVAAELADQHYAEQRKSDRHAGCATLEDYRELLARDDIDAVLIETPDHWHALQACDAAAAGKDIYCQKPASLTVAEGRAMVHAVRKHERILQVGSQQRSNGNFLKANEWIQGGKIGEIQRIVVGLPEGNKDFNGLGVRKLPEPVPDGFNYPLWLGPAPLAPYAPARCHINFRWIYDYAGGMVADWGAHHLDCAAWSLGRDRSGPAEIRGVRATFPMDPLWNTPQTFRFELHYRGAAPIICGTDLPFGVRWEGSEGWIEAGRTSLKSSRRDLIDTLGETDRTGAAGNDGEAHFREFIDAVIARRDPNTPIEVGHRSATLCHLANIAMRLGREKLDWDPQAERFRDDPDANDLLRMPYHNGWSHPQIPA